MVSGPIQNLNIHFQALNEVWNDHCHLSLSAANFLQVSLDNHTLSQRPSYDFKKNFKKKKDSCDSIHTASTDLPDVTYF